MKKTKATFETIIPLGFTPDRETEVQGDTQQTDEVTTMKILPLRSSVVIPCIPQPIQIGRESSINLVRQAKEKSELIFAVLQKNEEVENPGFKDLHKHGVLCRVLNVVETPDGSVIAFVASFKRGRLDRIIRKVPFLTGRVETCHEIFPADDDENFKAVISAIDDLYAKIIDFIGEDDTQEIRMNLSQFENSVYPRFYFMLLNSPLTLEEKQRILSEDDIRKQAEYFLHDLDVAFQKMQIKAEIHSRTHEDLSRQQKENFLMQQMKTIQDELGNNEENSDLEELTKRAHKKIWTDGARENFDKELAKLSRLNIQNPEYSVQFSYLDTYLSLPWKDYSEDNFSLENVEEILDRDHYGLDQVKERILEHIAVLKLRKDMKAPILCLYGPPGTGKTSLGRSVAEALGREYARVSLGGLHDESEIRGHRRTYIGAMPGRIITALSKCGKGNPVFVLDEIDKIGQDFKGDPSTALLEVLDPEQNSHFHDNYIDYDYDLSKIFFIATANDLSTISAPLRDRMEIIDISGYVTEEKIQIALRHLLPKALTEHGFGKDEVKMTPEAVRAVIESYTRECGVRQLDKKIAKVLRKLAKLKASDKPFDSLIDEAKVRELLGREEVMPELYENNDYAGVVTGLAWTQTGGDILFIETSLSPGKGDKLTLTGNLGNVMKESATIALQYLRANAERFGIDREKLQNSDIHIHVPEGAIPKDGPSAGVTMLTSLASALTGRKVRNKVAMTGEITLRGKVLPVGGIKEKILAAKRAGITDIVLCSQNRKDIEDIKPDYLEGLAFHYVDRVEQVLDYALLDEKASF